MADQLILVHLGSCMLFRFAEKGDIRTKIEALEKTIRQLLSGEKFSSILMTIIRFVLPSQDHTIKKLLLLFWEIVPKTHPDGKLLHEMILVCDAYRKVSYPGLSGPFGGCRKGFQCLCGWVEM